MSNLISLDVCDQARVRIEILFLALTIYKGEHCHKRKGHSQIGGPR